MGSNECPIRSHVGATGSPAAAAVGYPERSNKTDRIDALQAVRKEEIGSLNSLSCSDGQLVIIMAYT
jgi:hypothetical protein